MILILIAIPADANFLNGYASNGSVLVGYVLKIRIGGIYIGGIRLRFLLMHTFWMDTHWMDTHSMDTYWWDTCWTDTYWWDTYWWDTYCKTCWCKRFEWIRIAWIRTGGIRVERIRIGGIRIGGIRIGGIRFEWICVGYVWCDGYVWDMCGVRYVWDMCGVRYANNLLKNPATKRLSGKKKASMVSLNWPLPSLTWRFLRKWWWFWWKLLHLSSGCWAFCTTKSVSVKWQTSWSFRSCGNHDLHTCTPLVCHIPFSSSRFGASEHIKPNAPDYQCSYMVWIQKIEKILGHISTHIETKKSLSNNWPWLVTSSTPLWCWPGSSSCRRSTISPKMTPDPLHSRSLKELSKRDRRVMIVKRVAFLLMFKAQKFQIWQRQPASPSSLYGA